MSALRHTAGLESVLRWMGRTIDDAEKGGRPSVDLHHVDTWRDALLAIHTDLQAREQAVITAEANADPDPVTRIDRQSALRLVDSASQCVQHVCKHAAAGASRQEITEIDLAACAIIDVLEALARGVSRPAPLQKGS